jgi:ABC-2 type transport system permease protein
LAGLVAAVAALSSACVVCLFKDRERSQFIYSLGLLFAAGLSTLVKISPIQTISRLAVGDPYVGWLDLLLYAILLAGLGWVLIRSVRRLAI